MPTPEEIATFAGSNGPYYARAWQRLKASEGVSAGFNGAAFFLSVGWMLYRRLYDLAAIFGGLLLFEAVASDWYFTTQLHLTEAPRSWDLLVRVIVGVVSGQFGNRWYLRYAERSIEHNRASGHDLYAKGGTSWRAVVLGLAAFLLAGVLAFVVLGFFQEPGTSPP